MWRIVGIFLIGFTLVLSNARATPSADQPVLVGYIAAFKGLEPAIEQAPDAYTHFNIAFANPSADGAFIADDRLTCMVDGKGSRPLVETLRAAIAGLKAKGARVLISVGGGVIPACSGDWRMLLAPDQRPQTVAALVELAETLDLDGIDVDIEGALLTAIDQDGNYVPFIAALSEAMKARGKLLTCATASYEGGMVPIGSLPYFDLVNVMSYDAIGPSWGPPGAEHSPYAGAARDLDLWLARGVPRDRLVLGVPFYGYGFGGAPSDWSYRDLVAEFGEQAAGGDLIGTACPDCRYITFNGPATIERKARLAAAKAGGVMVWEVSQDSDDHVLTRAILRGLAADND